MKKIFAAFAAILLACSLLFCACSSTVPLVENIGPLVLATGGNNKTYHSYAGKITGILNETLNGTEITTKASGGSQANIFLIEDNEAQLAIVSSDVIHYAHYGTELFADAGAVTSFSPVAGLYAEVCQVVASENITSISNLKGKRVGVGESGSVVEADARHILAAYGLSFDDIIPFNYSISDAVDALKSGKIDAFVCRGDAPMKELKNLRATYGFRLLSIDNAHQKALKAEYPFYFSVTLPAGTYNDMDREVTTIAVKATLVASNSLSTDLVRSITKTLFEQQSEIADAHKKGAELMLPFAVDAITIPFHTGADTYYTEIGAI